MSGVSIHGSKSSISYTEQNNNSSPISLPSLTDLTGGQIQSSVGNEGSNIGGFVGNNAGGTINVLDAGAVSGGLNLAEKSVGSIVDLTAKLFEANRLNTQQFYNQVTESSQDALDYVSTYANKEGEENKILQKVLLGAGVLAGLFIVFKFSKWAK